MVDNKDEIDERTYINLQSAFHKDKAVHENSLNEPRSYS